MIEIRSSEPGETFAAGRRLAGLLRVGDIVLLAGPLGCGKTMFVSGVADGLGVEEPVTSPSFVLVHRYRGFLPVVHADVYRLGTIAEFADLEVAEDARDAVLLIEWGTAVEASVPPDHLVVEFDVTGEHTRTLRLHPRGTWTRRSLEELAS